MKTMRNENDLNPLEIKAKLILMGMDVSTWAKENGFLQPTVWYAIHRNHQGPLSLRIRDRLHRTLNLAQGEKQ